MKKTSKYSRKRAQMAGHGGTFQFNGAEFFNTIQRCRPYTTEGIPGTHIGDTQGAADNMRNAVNRALGQITRGEIPADGETHPFDYLAHAFGVALIRTIQIGGDNARELQKLKEGNDALRSIRDRHERIGKWGTTRPEQLAMSAAAMVYEDILQASSPAQMAKAADERMETLKEMGWVNA